MGGTNEREKDARTVFRVALSKFVHLHQELLVVGFPVRTVNAVEPVSLAALGTLDALGLAFLAVCAGPPRLGLCCQG